MKCVMGVIGNWQRAFGNPYCAPPGASAFTQIAQNVQAGEYEVLNLAVGAHKFKVAGVNSRGTGKVSAVTTFEVLAAAA